ncbi:hypothetical protein EBR03_03325 [bacterium]|nr:hypothetical protein [bacterium]
MTLPVKDRIKSQVIVFIYLFFLRGCRIGKRCLRQALQVPEPLDVVFFPECSMFSPESSVSRWFYGSPPFQQATNALIAASLFPGLIVQSLLDTVFSTSQVHLAFLQKQLQKPMPTLWLTRAHRSKKNLQLV